MSLTSLWKEQRNQLEGKHVRQIISFAGDGKLRDDNATSLEFRDYLSQITSIQLRQYVDECLTEKFEDNGFVLQDIVNQIGKRLGFRTTDGRYRGTQSQIGYDGLWEFPDGHVVVVEVKTTDAYQISLETIARYRREIINQGKASEENSSILIIIGREDRDTSNVEAQIRGSRYGWNIRIISVDALIKLLSLKEEVEDPRIIERISAILIPKEFTKLDDIIDMVFFTAEDIKEVTYETEEDDITDQTEKTTPVSFHDACIRLIESQIKQPIIKRSKTTYSTADDSIRFTCAVSKEYFKSGKRQYWFAFHPHQKEYLENADKGFVSFGCGSEKSLLMIPLSQFASWLDNLNTTTDERRSYWHVNILDENGELMLYPKKGARHIHLNEYLVK